MKTAQKTPFMDEFVTMPPCERTIPKTRATTAGSPAKHSKGLKAIFSPTSPTALRERLTLFDHEISLTPEHQTFLRTLVWWPLYMARKVWPSRPTTTEVNALTPMEHHRTNWQRMIAVNINHVGWGFERPYPHHGTTTET